MLARSKAELEIVPTPLPREHNQYRAGEEWNFALRFRGQPLAGATLRLVSDAGTQTRFASDAAGRVSVRFPADIEPRASQGPHGRGTACLLYTSLLLLYPFADPGNDPIGRPRFHGNRRKLVGSGMEH